jgi:hypothetical protein
MIFLHQAEVSKEKYDRRTSHLKFCILRQVSEIADFLYASNYAIIAPPELQYNFSKFCWVILHRIEVRCIMAVQVGSNSLRATYVLPLGQRPTEIYLAFDQS